MSKHSNDDSKSQPARLQDRPSKQQGTGHDFNIKGKVTNPGNGYGVHGGHSFNGAEKDASISYLDSRGKKGQEVNNYSGHSASNRTNQSGPTAYNSRPIPETYMPGTSNGDPSPNAVSYKDKKKGRGNSY